MKRVGKGLAVTGLALAAVYALASFGIYVAMTRPPSEFGRVMAKVPMPVMGILPFRSLWFAAREGTLRVGDMAPDFELPARDQSGTVRLSHFRGDRSVVLVFGSYTCPPFRRQVPDLNRLYREYGDQAAFYLVYVQEAHPSDLWQLPANIREQIVYASPETIESRADIASACVRELGIEIPALMDQMDDSTERAYTAWPDRLYLIDTEGRIAYKSDPGPWGFETAGLEQALQQTSTM